MWSSEQNTRKSESRTQCRSPMWMSGTQVLKPSLLLTKMYTSWKLYWNWSWDSNPSPLTWDVGLPCVTLNTAQHQPILHFWNWTPCLSSHILLLQNLGNDYSSWFCEYDVFGFHIQGKSCSICLSASGLFHLAECPLDSSMLLQLKEFLFVSRLKIWLCCVCERERACTHMGQVIF